jgi:hypothetical protein
MERKRKKEGKRDALAGQIQSPVGMRALTSTFPNLIDLLSFVVRRAERTGGMTDQLPTVLLENATQLIGLSEVQEPSAVKLRVRPFMICESP